MSAPLREGERVLLIDTKSRRYLIALAAGSEFHSHAGYVAHDDIIGRPEGTLLSSTRSARYRVFRPTLSDYVLKMPRGAQVIYPKDLGPLLMMIDVGPGVRVFESGVGSGAMSMAMLRAGAEVVGYELREDFARRAQANVADFLGDEAAARYRVEIRDSYEGVGEASLDRVMLDLPEPWRVVGGAEEALDAGGVLVAYTPSIVQATTLRERLGEGPWAMAETTEVLQRSWHIEGAAVRPDHRMVAHTGFLTGARKLATEG